MKNILLNIMYDGTNYSGFQRQPDKETIESKITEVMEKICNQKIKLQYAGRTDAGVHAINNLINVKLNINLSLKKFKHALNSLLPADIRISKAQEVDINFNSRYAVYSREYRYYIWTDKVLSPFKHLYYLHYFYPIEIDLLKTAASMIIGKKDFSSFRASDCCAKTSVREIKKIEIISKPNKVIIKIAGNAFLKNMVRIIVGTLLEINEKKILINDLNDIIRSKKRCRAGRTVPAKGLFLYKCKLTNC